MAKLFIAGHWSPAGKFTTLYCGPDAAKAETLYKGCEELGEARLYVNPMPSRARKNKPPRAPETEQTPEQPTAEPPEEAPEKSSPPRSHHKR